MISIQAVAYFWFQSKGGIVSHRNFIIANACFMIGQFAQAAESYTKGAMASFSIASLFFVVTAFGIFERYRKYRKDKDTPTFVN